MYLRADVVGKDNAVSEIAREWRRTTMGMTAADLVFRFVILRATRYAPFRIE